MDTIAAPQDNPAITEEEAKRHRHEIGSSSPPPSASLEVLENGLFSNDEKSELTSSNSYGHLNPFISDPATELTEDDIFRMKRLRLGEALTGTENQVNIWIFQSVIL